MARQDNEAKIAGYPDQRWNRLMVAFQHSRDAMLQRDPKEFSEIHEKHYDHLLAKIIQLAER